MKTKAKKTNTDELEVPHPITDKAATKLHETIDNTAESIGEAEEKVRDSIADTNEKLTESKERVKNQNEEMIESVTQYVNENPIASVGIAFAAGIIASRLLR